jgi:Membrane-bound metallopeptidase
MAVEFPTEIQRKKRKNRLQHKFPLVRIVFFFILIVVAYANGWFRMLYDKFLVPANEEPVAIVTEEWIEGCTSYNGTPFELKDEFAQCSWIVNDSLVLPNSFLRYIRSLASNGAKIHWVAPKKDFGEALLVVLEDSTRSVFLHMSREDSSKVWISSKTGCLFPGPCPHMPLGWSALAIVDNFDFEGLEQLLSADVFKGLGEAPIYPVLPGIVLEAGRDSLGMFVELNHGNGITSRMFGIGSWKMAPTVGKKLSVKDAVGRLSPQDSSSFFLTVRKNGLFVRWKDFYKSTHPVDSAQIAIFKKNLPF